MRVRNAETENAGMGTGTETRTEMGNDRQATFHDEKTAASPLLRLSRMDSVCVEVLRSTFRSAKQKRPHLRRIFLECILAARNEKY